MNARLVPIGEIARFVGGGTPRRDNPDYYSGDIPWVTPKDMKSWEIDRAQVHITDVGLASSAARLVPAGSVLIVVRSGVLKHTVPVGISRVPVAINQDMKALICSKDVDPNYLGRFIKERSKDVLSWVRATTADNFPIELLKELEVPLPSLSAQRRIVEVLDRADAVRAKRREALSRLDELAQSIFLEMFGDPSMNSRGWPVARVGDLLESATYGTSEKARASGDLPILRMNNITARGELDLTHLKYLDDASANERYIAKAGDILFNRTNSPELVGKSGLYRLPGIMAFAGYLVRLRVNSNNDPEYLAAFLNSRYAKRMLRNMCKSIIGMANINAREVQTIAIAVPPLILQREFACRIERVEALKTVMRAQVDGLDRLFGALQYRAFRGEL